MDNNLTKDEENLLILCLKEHNPELLVRVKDLYSKQTDNETVNKMREAIGNELIEEGFENNWEPNEYGLRLENLIDRLAHLYWK